MKKLTLFTIILVLTVAMALTTAIAQQSAEWKQNTITNQTTERVFVVYSTWRGADAAKQIPRGYRTVGHYAIDPSASRTFWAWANNSIYFRITKSGIPQKPQRDSTTVSHWIHPTRAFTAASATIGGTQPTYSTVNSNDLVNSDGFLKYQNGSQITVDNTWVDINEPPEDTRPGGDGEDAPGGTTAGDTAGTTATETKQTSYSGKRIGLFEDNYWYDKTFEFTFPGKVVDWSWRSSTSHANVDENAVRASGNTVYIPVRILAKTFPVATIELWVTATYEVTAPSPGAPSLHSQFGPETQQLSTFWQDLSQVPEKTALLPNYPNPFNPETWIPYELAEAAEVTVSIHASDGTLVRTLELGQLPAGVYQNRSRAAYWDGRNAQGEPVASGVYFYTLIAGDFSATRKMLIRK